MLKHVSERDCILWTAKKSNGIRFAPSKLSVVESINMRASIGSSCGSRFLCLQNLAYFSGSFSDC